jgi:hypothetical protein
LLVKVIGENMKILQKITLAVFVVFVSSGLPAAPLYVDSSAASDSFTNPINSNLPQ